VILDIRSNPVDLATFVYGMEQCCLQKQEI